MCYEMYQQNRMCHRQLQRVMHARVKSNLALNIIVQVAYIHIYTANKWQESGAHLIASHAYVYA